MDDEWTELEHSLKQMMHSAEELWNLNYRSCENDSLIANQTEGCAESSLKPSIRGLSSTAHEGEEEMRRRRRRLQQQQRRLSPSIENGHHPSHQHGSSFSSKNPLEEEDFAYRYEESSVESSSISSPSPPYSSVPSTAASVPSSSSTQPLPPTVPKRSLCAQPASISSTLSTPEDYRRLLDMQSVTAMEWIRETALKRLSRMFRQHGGGKLPSTPAIEAELGALHWFSNGGGKNGLLPTLSLGQNRQWAQRRMKLWSHNLMKKVRLVKALSNSNLHNGIINGGGEVDSQPMSSSLYGLPLSVVQARSSTGSPLPRFIHDIMEHLVENARQAEGVFRRNGVKLRIHEIKEQCGKLGVNDPLGRDVVAQSQLHDLADSLKQYFRELPECLTTDRVSNWLEQSARDFPDDARFTALHYCVILMPEENREALMILLKFLNQIAREAKWNQMSEDNLATCARRKTIGMPNEQERNAYTAVKLILTRMIKECDELCTVPRDMWKEMEHTLRDRLELNLDLEMPLRNGLFYFREDYQRLFRRQHQRLKESCMNGWQEWRLERVFPDGSQLFTLKTESGLERLSDAELSKVDKEFPGRMMPIRQFLLQLNNIPAPAAMLHSHLLHHRSRWERNVLETRRIGAGGQNFDVIKVTYACSTSQQLRKHAYLARRWNYASEESQIYTLIERSVVPKGVAVESLKPRLHYYKSAFLVASDPHNPASGQSQLNYLFCIDMRGKSAQWYERVGDEAMMEQLCQLREYLIRLNNSRLRAANGSLNPHHQRRETIV